MAQASLNSHDPSRSRDRCTASTRAQVLRKVSAGDIIIGNGRHSRKATLMKQRFLKSLRIVVASPSDVQAERESVEKVVQDLNRHVALRLGLFMELSGWETVPPGVHAQGPQAVIDSTLCIEDCDLLIGIFWKRFGTPVAGSDSGTEHEIRRAYDGFLRRGSPQLVVYFNQTPYTPRSQEDTQQWERVLRFKDELASKVVYHEYDGSDDFEDHIRKYLTGWLFDLQNQPVPSEVSSPTIMSCVIGSTPAFARYEGLTELVGDILLTVSGGRSNGSGGSTDTFDVLFLFNANVTNRLLRERTCDAILIPDTDARVDAIYGELVSPNVLLFRSVPVSPPKHLGVRVLRTTMVRVNANQVGLSSTLLPNNIVAAVSVQPTDKEGRHIVMASSQAAVASVLQGLKARLWRGANWRGLKDSLFERQSWQEPLLRAPSEVTVDTFTIEFSEGFPKSFRTQHEEAGSGGASLVGHGTRLLAVFHGLGQETEVSVTTRDVELLTERPSDSGPRAVLVSRELGGASSNAALPAIDATGIHEPPGNVPLVPLEVVNGHAVAVWEWVYVGRRSSATSENVSFGILMRDRCGRGDAVERSITVNYAPIGYAVGSSGSAPIPRFADVPIQLSLREHT